MLETKTHFEQVPLEIVRRIVQEQIRQGKAVEQIPSTWEITLEEDVLREQEPFMGRFDTFFQVKS